MHVSFYVWIDICFLLFLKPSVWGKISVPESLNLFKIGNVIILPILPHLSLPPFPVQR